MIVGNALRVPTNMGHTPNMTHNMGHGIARRRLPFFKVRVPCVPCVPYKIDITCTRLHTHAHMKPSAKYMAHMGHMGHGIDSIVFYRWSHGTHTWDTSPTWDIRPQRVPLGVVAFAGALSRDVSADAGFSK